MNYNPYSIKGKCILIEGLNSEIAQSLKDACIQAEAKVIEVPVDMTIEQMKIFVSKCPQFDGVSLTQDVNKSIMCQFVTERDAMEFLTKNVLKKMMLCKLLFKYKKLNKGSSVVFSSSIAGIDNVHFGDIINSMCSGALKSMSKSLGLELGTKTVRVNHVRYGVIATKDSLQGQILTPEESAEKEKYFPLKRFGTPEDVSNSILFLLSDASSWITGADLRIDGGYSIL